MYIDSSIIICCVVVERHKIGEFHLKEHAASYAQFRPTYPKEVIDTITFFMKSNNCSGFHCAVDACCGSGQSTTLLCNYFNEVTGYDVSEEQILQAHKSANVGAEFKTGDAHNLPIKTSSVDLLTCAMAWHWLDAERFNKEVKRVLKPNGCIAIYGYNITVQDNENFGFAVETFKQELMRTGFIDQRAIETLNEYKSLQLPFVGVERFQFHLYQRASMHQLIGFLSSFSSYTAYCQKFPGNHLLESILTTYENNVGRSRYDTESFTYPGYGILGINN